MEVQSALVHEPAAINSSRVVWKDNKLFELFQQFQQCLEVLALKWKEKSRQSKNEVHWFDLKINNNMINNGGDPYGNVIQKTNKSSREQAWQTKELFYHAASGSGKMLTMVIDVPNPDEDKDTMHLFDGKVEKGSASSDSRLSSVHATSQEMAGEKARQNDQSPSLHAANDAKAPLRAAAGAPDHHDDDSDDDDDKNKRPSKAAGGKEDSKNANDASERSCFFRESFSSQSKTHGISLSSVLQVDQGSLVWSHELLEIPFEQLKEATDGFNSSSVAKNGCLLGSGSFGDVYLGHLQWKNKPFLVAVKKFKPVLEKMSEPSNCIFSFSF